MRVRCGAGDSLVGMMDQDHITKWRLGKKVRINVYEGDRPVCQCHNERDAARIVEAMNRAKPLSAAAGKRQGAAGDSRT